MAARLQATGLAPKWDDYLTDASKMNGRVLRCLSLTTNLIKMMRVVENLIRDRIYGPVTDKNLVLARLLTWIMFYFYRAMFRFASEIATQNSSRSVMGQVCLIVLLSRAGRDICGLDVV